MTAAALRILILRVLAQSKPYSLPQDTLLLEVNRLARPGVTLPELVKLLSWLKAAEMIGFLPDSMDPKNADARKWHIREAGEAALQS